MASKWQYRVLRITFLNVEVPFGSDANEFPVYKLSDNGKVVLEKGMRKTKIDPTYEKFASEDGEIYLNTLLTALGQVGWEMVSAQVEVSAKLDRRHLLYFRRLVE
jgi:hypothetical protein